MDKFAAAVPGLGSAGLWLLRIGRRHLARAAGNPAAAHVPRHRGRGHRQPHGLQQSRRGSRCRKRSRNGKSAAAGRSIRWASISANPKSRRWKRRPEDYANSFRALRDLADFFVVNVSSPNTPGLRQLQDKAALDEILAASSKSKRPPPASPILVKVAPDLSFEALDEILELADPRRIAGIVATNTTITRPQTDQPGPAKHFTPRPAA